MGVAVCGAVLELLFRKCDVLMRFREAPAWMQDVKAERGDGDGHAVQADEEVLVSQDGIIGPAWTTVSIGKYRAMSWRLTHLLQAQPHGMCTESKYK